MRSSRAPLQGGPSTTPAESPSSTGPARPSLGRRERFDAVPLSIIRLMCLAARQFLSLVSATPKLTNVWLVLETGDGSAASPFYGHIINCAMDGDAVEQSESDKLVADWWAFRGGKQGRRQAAKAFGAAARVSGNKSEAVKEGAGRAETMDGDGNKADGGSGDATGGDGSGDKAGGDDGGDAASSGATSYQEQRMLSRSAVKAFVARESGRKTLTKDALAAVLVSGGLENFKEITYGDIEGIFIRAAVVLWKRCDANSPFFWARFCPLPLLANGWSTPAMPHFVDSSDFVLPNHRSSKGQGVDKKRLMVCVAVHLSPIFAQILEEHFAACRASGKKKRKRSNDPFDGAATTDGKPLKITKRASGKGKLTNLEKISAAAKARLKKMEMQNAAAPPRSRLMRWRPAPSRWWLAPRQLPTPQPKRQPPPPRRPSTRTTLPRRVSSCAAQCAQRHWTRCRHWSA
eukprot:TRINITY_DN2488_c0_g1_i1.p1 TRINITY_DN2488_c0_g1~~TRINITY_DN2488_c0_g1_i1.p1  ORF type:complete len:460 (+),score=94.01 TRINITY_DN2488_c0_g1_i1:871-2250(+)